MMTRKAFLKYVLAGMTAVATAFFATACGKKPDVETEPSPEWPPKEEE